MPKNSKRSAHGAEGKPEDESLSVQLRHVCLEYPYKQLEAATNGFHESFRLGEGSAGTVFRAQLPDGSDAAVKLIDLATLGDNALVAGFEDEIMILSKFRHPNLVVLMGWAKQGTRRILIYEFLPGGDVAGRLLKCKNGRLPFLWHERLSVARDSATGLAHLHNATPRAFHRDIKSANILLGPSGAKMADFGLSCVAKTRTGSAVDCKYPSGTPGYACPIYMTTGKVNEGSEVHSFGIFLLEVLLNMVPAGMVGDELKYPIQEVIMPLRPGALERALGYADPTAGWPPPVAKEVASLALRCIDREEGRRPCFNDVCRQLRTLQEQFPPTCVLGPQVALPSAVPAAPPGMAGVPCHTLAPFQQGGPAVATVLPGHTLGPGGPQAQGPALPPGGVWVPHGPLGPDAAAWASCAHLGPGPPCGPPGPPGQGAPPFVPPGFAGQGPPAPSFVVPAMNLPGPPYPPGPGMFSPPAPPPGWAMTAMAGTPAAPAMGLCQPVAVAAAAAPAPFIEVALEITYVHLAMLAAMKPEFRMMPLVPSVDAEGRRVAKIGRAYQPQWFEAVLMDLNDLNCISREACELCWGGPDPAQAGLALRVLGTGLVIVDDAIVTRETSAPLRPGSRITFASQGDCCIIIALAVHCAANPAASPRNGAHPVPEQLPFQVSEPKAEEACWRLECVYAAGFAPEAFLALPASVRHLAFALTPEAPAMIIGRQHQREMFEALLAREPKLLSYVSRSHFRLEMGECEMYIQNLCQNVAVVAQRPLHQGESTEVLDGDRLSFTHSMPPEPFLTFQLVGPPPPLPLSSWMILNSSAAPPASLGAPCTPEGGSPWRGAPDEALRSPEDMAVASESPVIKPATAPQIDKIRVGSSPNVDAAAKARGPSVVQASTAPVARPKAPAPAPEACAAM